MLSNLKYDPIQYLLGARQQAWIKYITLVKILNRSENDPDVKYFREKRDHSAIVKRIREKQHQDGSFPCMPWMHIHKYYFHQLLDMGFGSEDVAIKKGIKNLLNYQLPNGGYMHPCGRYVNVPNQNVGWGACVTDYVTHALMNLGFQNDRRVKIAVDAMLYKQRDNGGWICNTNGKHSPYCIKSGTPWVFRCLAMSGLINRDSRITEKALSIFKKHKRKIIRHGYQKDNFYRCDEALLLPALYSVGLPQNHSLVKYFTNSLLKKQQPNGSWLFCGKPSPWYTIEVLIVLKNMYK